MGLCAILDIAIFFEVVGLLAVVDVVVVVDVDHVVVFTVIADIFFAVAVGVGNVTTDANWQK